MPRVTCDGCEHYKTFPGLTHEPLGVCENDDVLTYADISTYRGNNWRLNHRDSKVKRYCRGFKPKTPNT